MNRESAAMGWIEDWLARRQGHAGKAGRPRAEEEVAACLRDEFVPALETVRARLAASGYETELEQGEDWIQLSVMNFNGLPLTYLARTRVYTEALVNLASFQDQEGLKRFGKMAIEAGGRTREYRLARCRRASIERAVSRYYERFLMDTPLG